ncbi:hypothetical protein TEA_012999 [Camellia sinensis var. sinensis]|uniref:Ubiquitin-like protease family profile domain-containing protein n=1 Tax=Camellia sinensis var. sinensis TaxID=542762 RepID=A0A4S4E679_CAMSN|nr:hypothetical protein TEA_012999 [Camellia sinensis var. sinensis]
MLQPSKERPHNSKSMWKPKSFSVVRQSNGLVDYFEVGCEAKEALLHLDGGVAIVKQPFEVEGSILNRPNFEDTTVVVSPDYIIYGDMHINESQLTFSCCYIKVEGSSACGIKVPFSFKWTVGDIINIESQWCGQVETAVVKLHLKSKDMKAAENTNTSSGIAELRFAVFDPNWSEREEAIKSLDVRYKAKWNLVSDIDTRSESACLGNNNIFFEKHYFSTPDDSFEEVVYPKGDPDAVSISKRDIELLRPETFINDTIIDFYIKYLKNKIKPEEKNRFHFFNSFFFRKLADLDRGPSRACKGRAAFQRVHKWTRKVNLFEKDYIFIPVNFSNHSADEDVKKLSKVPCILHMDSIKGSHRGLKNLIQSYLWEEWKERQNRLLEDVSSKFLNLRFVPLELPQQENSFDCGLFLLHYVELFLDRAPVDFSPFKITKFSNFMKREESRGKGKRKKIGEGHETRLPSLKFTREEEGYCNTLCIPIA